MNLKKITCFMAFVLLLSLSAPVIYAGDDDDGKLNINTATVEELVKIPGINQEMADSIIEAREENGEFVDLEELLDIDGISSKLLRQLKKHIKVEELDGCNC